MKALFYINSLTRKSRISVSGEIIVNNTYTVWVKYKGNVIKRNKRKHGVIIQKR